MATATTTYDRDRSVTETPGGDYGAPGGNDWGLAALVDALRARRVAGGQRPMRDEVNVGRTKTRGGAPVFHQPILQGHTNFGGPSPEQRASRAQAKMAEIAAKDASARYQAARRGPSVEHRTSGGLYLGLQPKTETMNAYQRELYLPQGSAIGPSPQRDMNDELRARSNEDFNYRLAQDRERGRTSGW